MAIIIVSSLAFLFFQARKDVIGRLAMSEARLALQFASAKARREAIHKEIILDTPNHPVSEDVTGGIPALSEQVTVIAQLPLDGESLSGILKIPNLVRPGSDDTRGHFVIRQGRLFASVQDENTIAATSAPLGSLVSGLLSRLAIDIAGVVFLGVLLLLVRESRLSDHSVRRLLDASPVPLFLINTEGRAEFANVAALDLFFGCHPATLKGFQNGLRSQNELIHWLIDASNMDDRVATREFEITIAQDRTLHFLTSRQSFRIRSRRIIIASMVDITIRHDAEAALMRAKEAAEALAKMKSESFAMISHELRTPVNGVLGLSQLLELQSLPKSAAQIASRITQAGRTLAVIINDIVDLAMLETGHLRLNKRRFDPKETITGAVSLATAIPNQSGIAVHVTTGPAIPSYLIGDPARLQQIIINIVGNGIKFTEVGSIEVRVDCVVRDLDNADITIDVIDTGVGIPPHIIPRLFQPSSQAETGHRRRFDGLGLGLAISKRLIEAMGGQITVQSEVGRGSTFRIVLPFESSPVAEVIEDLDRTMGLRVLVVDDVSLNRDVITQMLRAEHCEVSVAGSGQDAIEKVATEPFDLVLMDIRMPGMDGLAATTVIRSNRKNLPIFGLTANPLQTDRPLYLLRGIDYIVEKPVEREQLKAALRRCQTLERVQTQRILPPRLFRLQESLGSERTRRIVAMFAEVAAEATETIAHQCSHMNFSEVAEAAHRLCGTASNIGLDEISESAAHLEIVAREGSSEKVSIAALTVILAFKNAELTIEQWKTADEASNQKESM